jgi:hypothetical protein
MRDLGQHLVALNDVMNKGVHGFVTKEEIDHCLTQTFFVFRDIVRLEARRRSRR